MREGDVAGEDAWLSPMVRVNSSDGPADAVDLGTTGWDGQIPEVFLPKTHSLSLIVRNMRQAPWVGGHPIKQMTKLLKTVQKKKCEEPTAKWDPTPLNECCTSWDPGTEKKTLGINEERPK